MASTMHYPRLEDLLLYYGPHSGIHAVTLVLPRLHLPQLRDLHVCCVNNPQAEALVCALLGKLSEMPSLQIIRGRLGCLSVSPLVKQLKSLCGRLEIEVQVQWGARS